MATGPPTRGELRAARATIGALALGIAATAAGADELAGRVVDAAGSPPARC